MYDFDMSQRLWTGQYDVVLIMQIEATQAVSNFVVGEARHNHHSPVSSKYYKHLRFKDT